MTQAIQRQKKDFLTYHPLVHFKSPIAYYSFSHGLTRFSFKICKEKKRYTQAIESERTLTQTHFSCEAIS